MELTTRRYSVFGKETYREVVALFGGPAILDPSCFREFADVKEVKAHALRF